MASKMRPYLKVERKGEEIAVSIVGARGGVRHTYVRSYTRREDGPQGMLSAVTQCLVNSGIPTGKVEGV